RNIGRLDEPSDEFFLKNNPAIEVIEFPPLPEPANQPGKPAESEEMEGELVGASPSTTVTNAKIDPARRAEMEKDLEQGDNEVPAEDTSSLRRQSFKRSKPVKASPPAEHRGNGSKRSR